MNFLFPLIGIVIGIILGDIFPQLPLGFLCIGLAIIFWLCLTIYSKNPVKSEKIAPLHSIWIILLFSGIGSLTLLYHTQPFPSSSNLCNKNITITGEIENVKYLTQGDRFIINITSINDSGKSVICRNLKTILQTDGFVGSVGDKISYNAKPSNIYEFYKNKNIADRFKKQGILWHTKAKAHNIILKGETTSFSRKINSLRDYLIILLEKSSLNRDTSEFLISILLGDKTFLSPEIRQTLTGAGLAHILALSGMHVAIILSLLLILLFPLSLLGERKTSFSIALILIWGYVILTGSSPSTVRAAIMCSFVIMAIILERKNSAINSLFAATLIIILINPLNLWDIGMQMSFMCVLSILLFTSYFNPIDHHAHPRLYKLTNLVLISLITSISTWVITVYYFNSVSLLFLPLNIIILPLLPAFVSLGICFLVFLSFGIDVNWLGNLLDIFFSLIIKSSDVLSFSGKGVWNGEISLFTVFTWLLGLMTFAFFIYSKNRKEKKLFAIFSPCLFLISIITPLFITNHRESTTLKFKHSFTKIEAQLYSSGSNTKLEFPRQKISSVKHNGINILSIDQKIHPDSLFNIVNSNYESFHFLIVGPQSDTKQVAEVINSKDFEKIILHSGIGEKKKGELLLLLDESSIDKIYSLRDNGSLEFEI